MILPWIQDAGANEEGKKDAVGNAGELQTVHAAISCLLADGDPCRYRRLALKTDGAEKRSTALYMWCGNVKI